jgi:uncharacterized protein (DUF2141 family)
MKKLSFLIFISFLLWSCARVGSPVGGKKDSLAPKFLHASIDTTRVNVPVFTKELRLDFDKYVLLKDINKNLTISPPIKKIKKILPNSLANKYVLIQWEDTLKANTTYNFNFGNAIVDNNEGNVLPYFNFAFSTGDKLDDLYLSGEAKDALKIKDKKETKAIVVGLYPEKDSMDFRQKPYYISKADEDGYFELNYLSSGKYRIIAFEDDNANSIYDAGKEKVGFLKAPIDIEKSISGLKLNVYPSVKLPKFKEIKSILGGVLFLFEGQPENVEIKPLNEKLNAYQLTHTKKSDSAIVWFDAKKQNIGMDGPEGLKFSYSINNATKKETSISFRNSTKNDLTLNSEEAKLAPEEKFKINSNYWTDKIQPEKWSLKVDSLTTQPFSAEISPTNPYQILVKSDFKTGKKYQLTIPKETVASFYQSNDKSYLWDITSEGIENYGKLKIHISPLPKHPFWLKLYNASDEVVYSQKANKEEVDFDIIKPGNYFLKIFVDENENGYWDESDFEKQQFAEYAKLYYKPIVIKALWEMVENWDLNDNKSLDTSAAANTSYEVNKAEDKSKSQPSKQKKTTNPELRDPGKLKLKN